jgi:N-acetylglucosaminyl-diphospho-decaprenol L-rhamnosyltransferase
VLVSWRDAADLEEAVRSLAMARDAALRRRRDVEPALIVVGNGGGEESVRREPIEAAWPGARILENRENRGLGPAANQAAAAAPDADAYLFMNPDARAVGDVFSPLADAFDARPDAVAFAPRLLDADEDADADDGAASRRPLAPPGAEDQRTFQLRRLPRLSSDLRELLLWDHVFPNGPARRRARYADSDRALPFDVEQAAGAVFAVRADAFSRIGGFDETFVPAWFEDVDLCARLLALGPIVYWPDIRFRHAGGASSVRLGYDRFLPILYENALRYRRKHYGPGARAVYRGALAAGMALRLAILPFRSRLPRPRPEAARAYRAVLARALGRRAEEERKP